MLSILGSGTGASVTIAGPTTMSGAATFDVEGANSLTLAGPVSGSNGLSKTGPGTLYLAASNSFGGTTAMNGGVLSLANSAALPVGGGNNIQFAGGTLQFSAANTNDYSAQILGSTGPISIDTNGQGVSFGAGLAASNVGGLTVLGGGTLGLSGNSGYSGPTTVSNGLLLLAGSSAGASGSAYTVSAGAQLAVGSGVASATLGSLSGAGSVALSSAALSVGANNQNSTFSGVVNGAGSLVKTGSGTFTFNGSLAATAAVNQGTLVAGPAALGSSPLVLSGGIFQPTLQATQGLNAGYYLTASSTGNGANISSTSLANFTGTYLSGLAVKYSDNVTANLPNGASGVMNFDQGGEGHCFPTGQLGQTVNFAAKFNGYFYAAQTGSYTFNTYSDDGSMMWAGSSDAAVSQNGGSHGEANSTNTAVALTAGNYYPITIGYDNQGGGYGLQVSYTPPGGSSTLLPVSLLYSAFSTATYSSALSVTQNSAINLLAAPTGYQFPSLAIGGQTLSVTGGAAGASVTIAGATTMSGATTFNVEGANTLNLAGAVSGASGLSKIGGGTLLLGASNSFTGGVTVTAGAVQLGAAGALNGNAVTLNSSPGLIFGSGVTSVSLAGLSGSGGMALQTTDTPPLPVALSVNPAQNGVFSGVLSGSGSLLVGGPALLTLAGSNTYTGGTTLSGGTLQLGDGQSNNGSVAGNIVNNAALIFANPQNQVYSGSISGSGGLTKTGAGVLTLGGTHSYNGPTVVAQGTLQLAPALPDYRYYEFVPTAINGNTNPTANIVQLSEFAFYNAAGTRVYANSVTNPNGTYAGSEGPANLNDNNLGTKWCETTANFANMHAYFDMGSPTPISGYNLATAVDSASYTRTPSGWQLLGSNDDVNFSMITAPTSVTYPSTNRTWYNSGTPYALVGGATNPLPVTTALSIAAGATFDLNGNGQQVGSLSDGPGGGGSVTNSGSGSASVLSVATAGTATFSGSITDGNGQVALVMNGAGTQVLAGTSSYSGATTISAVRCG